MLTVAFASVTAQGECSEESAIEDPRLLEVKQWLAGADSKAALPTTHLSTLTDSAWSNSSLALDLLREISDGSISAEVLGSFATALARRGQLDAAASTFERAAALPPINMQHLTKHRQHNLEQIHGVKPLQQQQLEAIGGGDGDGGWGGESGRAGTEACDIDVRTDLTPTEFEERYVLQGRPVLLPLHSVVRRNPQAQPKPAEETCVDSGPWPCTEAECPGNPLGCEALAALGVCERAFGQVWDSPPDSLTGSEIIADRCPRACGVCAAAPGLAAVDESSLWNRQEFVRRAGACLVPVVATSGVADHQYARSGRGGSGSPQQQQQITIAEYVQTSMGYTDGDAGASAAAASTREQYADPPYIVYTRPSASAPATTPIAQQQKQCWGILDRAMKLGGLGLLPNAFLEEQSHKRILFAGPAQSGTYFHVHSNAFNLMPYGRKHWLLVPPSGSYELPEVASAGGKTMQQRKLSSPTEWLRRHNASTGTTLPIRPVQCIQPAGTALFVPSGWSHAIINLAPSVGVAVEVGDIDVMKRAQPSAGGQQRK